MTFDEMTAAVQEAEHTLRVASNQVSVMARLVAGKLRSSNVSSYTLEQLKRELRDFNIHTGCWKDTP